MGVEITTQTAPELTTERLRLRPLAVTDVPCIRALAGDLAVARRLARVPYPYPQEEAEQFNEGCRAAGAHVWAH